MPAPNETPATAPDDTDAPTLVDPDETATVPASKSSTAQTPAMPTASSPKRTIPRSFRGYKRSIVEGLLEQRDQRIDELSSTLARVELALAERLDELTQARSQLRFWDDRSAFVEEEIERARTTATEIESAARARANAIETAAQQQAVQLVDRVCTEANDLLASARTEAREMFLRFEGQVDASRSRLESLERAQRRIIDDMRQTVTSFERTAEHAQEIAAPAQRPVELLAADDARGEQTTETSPAQSPKEPTFGRARAIEAAEAFEARAGGIPAAAIDVPLLLPKVLAASVRSKPTNAEAAIASD